MLTIGMHSISSCCGSVDPSPSIGARVRSDANAHHPDSQHLELLWGGLSTTRSASSRDRAQALTIEIHSVLSGFGSSCPQPDRCRPACACRQLITKFTAFAGRRCRVRAAYAWWTRGAAGMRPNGENDRRIDETGMNPCGYLSPAFSRRAVNVNGEPRSERTAYRLRCGNHGPTPVETLCSRKVRVCIRLPGQSADVDIPPLRPVGTLCILSVSAPVISRSNPCRTGRERPPPARCASSPFQGHPPARHDTSSTARHHPARKLSQIPPKTCAVFLAIAPPEQDEKKLSRLSAKK